MYNCPNCSGNLSFDIASQKLMCDFCKTQFDPYEYQKTQDAEESDVFGVTVFTCPQCGGEIMTTNVTAAGFCTYCGASTILDSRMRQEKRPTHIIPFKRTKEDCRKSYSNLVKKALFAPGQLRDPEYLDKFRGIYIPYWVYDYRIKGNLSLNGKKEYRRGDYRYTDHYHLSGEVDAQYKGITYDASSSFDDNVAESIAPFKAEGMQPFTPSILCGFYADAPDVDSGTYSDKAYGNVCEDALNRLSGVPEYIRAGVEMPDTEQFGNQLRGSGTSVTASEPVCAYLPVWFLTYRKDDRVAYAVMNGSTGRITADLPVDEKKYVLGSLLLSIPIFAVLALLFTMTGHTVLLFSSVLALLSLAIYTWETSEIADRDNHADDRGFKFAVSDAHAGDGGSKSAGSDAYAGDGGFKSAGSDAHAGDGGFKSAGRGTDQAPPPKSRKPSNREKKKEAVPKLINLGFPLLLIIILSGRSLLAFVLNNNLNLYAIYGIVSNLLLLVFYYLLREFAESDTARKGMYLHTAGSVIAVIAAGAVLAWNPPYDLWYYAVSVVAAVGVCLTFLGIIRKYNLLATRPLPTFYDRKGGNDRAK